MATFGALLAMLLLFKSVESGRLRAGWYCGSVVVYIAATFVHQEVISWAAIYVAALMLVTWRAKGRVRVDRWPLMVPYCAVALATLLIQQQVPNAEHSGISMQMLTFVKNYLSNSIYPQDFSNANAQFAAFVGMLLIVALVPAVRLLARRGTIPVKELFLVLWFVVAVAPLTTLAVSEPAFLRVGVFSRKLYVAGPSIALLLVSLGASLLALVPPRMESLVRIGAGAVLVVGLGWGLNVANDRRNDMSDVAEAYGRYTDQMRAAVPSVPTGGTLYVVGAPPVVLYFGEIYRVAIAQAYYGRVDVEPIDEQRASELEKALPPGAALFRYRP
jgi:hypothetical protein